ncbi:ribonuclease H-like domain-containing protein [Tanacetum coccineum]
MLCDSTSECTNAPPPPPTTEWLKIDSIVMTWIFVTHSDKLQERLVVMIKLGDLIVDAYFCKIKSIATILNSLSSPMNNDDIVTFALQGLSAKFDQVVGIISNQEPFPDLATVHNMGNGCENRSSQRSYEPQLFHHNYVVDGTLSHYKARLVANGSTQLEGIDVDETCSPVVKLGTTRTVLSLATSWQWLVHQLDAKNAFLHGDLSKAIYMHQPPVFWDSAHPDYVCLL